MSLRLTDLHATQNQQKRPPAGFESTLKTLHTCELLKITNGRCFPKFFNYVIEKNDKPPWRLVKH